MLFISNNKISVICEEEYLEKIKEIEKALEEYCHCGNLQVSSQISLAYGFFKVKNAKGTIVILHGFTEFSRKYGEIIWYFINMGYNVFIYDQRGHGYSSREVEDPQLTHVNDFHDYVEDLHSFVKQVVIPNSDNTPLYLYSHSMGGAIAARYIEMYPQAIEKAVLSSPMISPKTWGFPRFVVRQSVTKDAKGTSWESPFKYSSRFSTEADFEKSSDTSFARFRHNLDLRIANEKYQNSASTNRWMLESVNIKDHIMKHENIDKIKAKVLVINAGCDTAVHTAPQIKFCKMLGNKARFETIEGAKHSIFVSDKPTLEKYLSLMLDFFSAQ